jgi:hypothetical protein
VRGRGRRAGRLFDVEWRERQDPHELPVLTRVE